MDAASESTLAKRESDLGQDDSPESSSSSDSSGVGLYKYGQGYWVRTLTAIAAGILVLATALWAWDSLNAIRLPMHQWRLSTTRAVGTPSVGMTVKLFKADVQPPVELGTAKVAAVEGAAVTVGDIVITAASADSHTYTLADGTQMQSEDGAYTANLAQRSGIEVFDKVYLQMGVALVIIIVGCVIIYVTVGKKHSTVDFLVATDGEMKKVNWSTRKVILDSTYVVIGATILVAGVLYLFDFGLSQFFRAIGVLEG